MRRLLRWLLNGLTVLSLVLCVATVVLWVRSYWRQDSAVRGRAGADCVELYSGHGELLVATSGRWPRAAAWSVFSAPVGSPAAFNPAVASPAGARWSESRIAGVYVARTVGWLSTPSQRVLGWTAAPRPVLTVTVPLAWPAGIAAALPAARGSLWWLRRCRRRRLRRSGAHCTTCDYDLTGNVSGVCPECGTPVAKGAA